MKPIDYLFLYQSWKINTAFTPEQFPPNGNWAHTFSCVFGLQLFRRNGVHRVPILRMTVASSEDVVAQWTHWSEHAEPICHQSIVDHVWWANIKRDPPPLCQMFLIIQICNKPFYLYRISLKAKPATLKATSLVCGVHVATQHILWKWKMLRMMLLLCTRTTDMNEIEEVL